MSEPFFGPRGVDSRDVGIVSPDPALAQDYLLRWFRVRVWVQGACETFGGTMAV